MADASRDPTPAGWSDAFAALPLESPPASRWPQIAARLDAPHPERKHHHWLALAAGLCALAALPLAWTLRDAGKQSENEGGAHGDTTVVATPRIDPPSAAQVGSVVEASAENPASPPPIAVARAPTPSATDAEPADRRDARRERRLATTTSTTAAEAASAPSDPESAAVASEDASGPTLESLYAASSQLETLLALTRDTRVESGPAAALAGALDAELATIDAQLAQPGLEAMQQRALWQARVDTLRHATDFETQQRVLSAQGRSYEGALVRVD
jgi:hypothetical protein